ncbi:hypothetical protein [uncultured Microbacterium sp.]|uniref:hypothetical protein n=1 Tax=uncultured Microbacterium sp. TaxID=191216 RepID=UPI0035CC41B2
MDSEKVELRPILEADRGDAAAFLHECLNDRVSVADWMRLLSPPWAVEASNSGFQLRAGDRIVGVYAAVYSEREIDGERLRFCNLAAFCVLDDHRAHSFRLLRAILGQQGFEFTDLSPSGNVVALNERMGFERLDSRTTLAVNIPAVGARGVSLSGDPTVLRATLTGADAAIYRDHRDAAAARHLVVVSGDEYAYLVFRKDRRKRIPVFATPLYAGGSRELLQSAWPRVASHLLLRHGLLATLAEERILGFAPRAGRPLVSPRAKMFRSKIVSAASIDYLYSELTLMEW